jgi:hypothetical protein
MKLTKLIKQPFQSTLVAGEHIVHAAPPRINM